MVNQNPLDFMGLIVILMSSSNLLKIYYKKDKWQGIPVDSLPTTFLSNLHFFYFFT